MTVDDFKLLHPIVKEEISEEKNKYAEYYNALPINFQDTEGSDASKKGEINQDNDDDSN